MKPIIFFGALLLTESAFATKLLPEIMSRDWQSCVSHVERVKSRRKLLKIENHDLSNITPYDYCWENYGPDWYSKWRDENDRCYSTHSEKYCDVEMSNLFADYLITYGM